MIVTRGIRTDVFWADYKNLNFSGRKYNISTFQLQFFFPSEARQNLIKYNFKVIIIVISREM